MTDAKGSTPKTGDIHVAHKEWDEMSCPICMDHPHNAVLLVCSSHDKGCRSYICDTSYRHSNCLDRFKKPKGTPQLTPTSETLETSESILGRMRIRRNVVESLAEYSSEENNEENLTNLFEAFEETNNNQEPEMLVEPRVEARINHEGPGEGDTHMGELSSLKCPLCRGTVLGWLIVKEARVYLDLKSRNCSRESCSFVGNYRELRRHARSIHPTTRPADVDPSRQRAWSHLEHQREYGDIVSAVRSAMPGAIVLGDYVIDDGDRLTRDREGGGGSWLTTFVLFHMIGTPIESLDEASGSSRVSSRVWRARRRSSSGRRTLWGENLLGLQEDDENENLDDDNSAPRRRRRITRSRSDEERP